MRTKTIREWTYEEVRKALDSAYGDVAGVKVASTSGYILEECPITEQPSSAPEPKEEEPTP